MRIGQALGLRHGDFVSRDLAVHIVPRKDNANGARTKTRYESVIPISVPLARLYSAYMFEEYGDLGSDYVFVNLWAQPLASPFATRPSTSLSSVYVRARGPLHPPHAPPQPGDEPHPRRGPDRSGLPTAHPPLVGDHELDLCPPRRSRPASRAQKSRHLRQGGTMSLAEQVTTGQARRQAC